MENETVDEKVPRLASRVEELEKVLEAIKALTFGNGLGFPQWLTRIVEIRKLSSNGAGAHAEEKPKND